MIQKPFEGYCCIVINCCWQLKEFSYDIVIVNKYFLPCTKIILVVVIV